MAAYFVVAIGVAIDHRHYISIPFLCLFLCGFGYVGWGSVWQGGFGAALRGAFGRRGVTVVAPPAYPVVAGRATRPLRRDQPSPTRRWSSRAAPAASTLRAAPQPLKALS